MGDPRKMANPWVSVAVAFMILAASALLGLAISGGDHYEPVPAPTTSGR